MALRGNQAPKKPGKAPTTKAWTVMVYLAADTTLTNFAVESLKQMKASQSDWINIVAEFDSGPRHSTERYFFGKLPENLKTKELDETLMEDRLASISNNIVMRLEPQDVGDPETLTNFIDWSVQKYPARHYFLIIWGHGSGIDDSLPRTHDRAMEEALEKDRHDRFFISRHRPLPTGNLEFGEAAQKSQKSVAFVDRPISYLTNSGLRIALQDAQDRIRGWKTPDWRLDLLGMDACNMNLIELGYELRDFANYMIASQDEIPDASWPYYQILHDLGEEAKKQEEKMKLKQPTHHGGPHNHKEELYTKSQMQNFVNHIVRAYAGAYQDYIDQPVALSALKLTFFRENLDVEARGDKIRGLFKPLAEVLQLHSTHREINDAIIFARRRVRSFYTHIPATRDLHTRDIYIDLIHFCKLLYSFLEGHKVQPKIAQFISKFERFSFSEEPNKDRHRNDQSTVIAVNEKSRGEDECNGTSIYFPATPQDEFGSFYEELEFAQDTVWPAFVSDFLEKNPDLLILPRIDLRNGHVKGNPHDDAKGNPNDDAKGNPNDASKRSHRIVVQGASPVTATHNCDEKINPAIYNVIYNYGTIIETGCDEDMKGG
jgi:hypothetical protein